MKPLCPLHRHVPGFERSTCSILVPIGGSPWRQRWSMHVLQGRSRGCVDNFNVFVLAATAPNLRKRYLVKSCISTGSSVCRLRTASIMSLLWVAQTTTTGRWFQASSASEQKIAWWGGMNIYIYIYSYIYIIELVKLKVVPLQSHFGCSKVSTCLNICPSLLCGVGFSRFNCFNPCYCFATRLPMDHASCWRSCLAERIHFSAECLDPDDHVFTLRAPMQAGDAA